MSQSTVKIREQSSYSDYITLSPNSYQPAGDEWTALPQHVWHPSLVGCYCVDHIDRPGRQEAGILIQSAQPSGQKKRVWDWYHFWGIHIKHLNPINIFGIIPRNILWLNKSQNRCSNPWSFLILLPTYPDSWQHHRRLIILISSAYTAALYANPSCSVPYGFCSRATHHHRRRKHPLCCCLSLQTQFVPQEDRRRELGCRLVMCIPSKHVISQLTSCEHCCLDSPLSFPER